MTRESVAEDATLRVQTSGSFAMTSLQVCASGFLEVEEVPPPPVAEAPTEVATADDEGQRAEQLRIEELEMEVSALRRQVGMEQERARSLLGDNKALLSRLDAASAEPPEMGRLRGQLEEALSRLRYAEIEDAKKAKQLTELQAVVGAEALCAKCPKLQTEVEARGRRVQELEREVATQRQVVEQLQTLVRGAQQPSALADENQRLRGELDRAVQANERLGRQVVDRDSQIAALRAGQEAADRVSASCGEAERRHQAQVREAVAARAMVEDRLDEAMRALEMEKAKVAAVQTDHKRVVHGAEQLRRDLDIALAELQQVRTRCSVAERDLRVRDMAAGDARATAQRAESEAREVGEHRVKVLEALLTDARRQLAELLQVRIPDLQKRVIGAEGSHAELWQRAADLVRLARKALSALPPGDILEGTLERAIQRVEQLASTASDRPGETRCAKEDLVAVRGE